MATPPPTSRDEALDYLYRRIDYERAPLECYGEQTLKLARMRRLAARLGLPDERLPIVHVAGTKGKGSTAATVAAILSAAGLRTGLFSSPHLDRLEERMAIDGAPATGDELVALVATLAPHIEAIDREAAAEGSIGPTWFEITTAMALLHFARHRTAAAVLEVGLGGRLDSTNICTPEVSVITSISYDHTRQLGNTLTAIAREKAGIIKPGVPVVSGVEQDEPRAVVAAAARAAGSRLLELGRDFQYDYHPGRVTTEAILPGRLDFRCQEVGATGAVAGEGGRDAARGADEAAGGDVDVARGSGDEAARGGAIARAAPASEGEVPRSRATSVDWRGLPLPLLGAHQAANTAVALATIQVLCARGWPIDTAAVHAGLSRVICPARIEVVSRRPLMVLDAAHNVASVDALLESLDKSFPAGRRLLVFAASQDKDLAGMLGRLLPRFDRIVLTRYECNPRSVPPDELARLALRLGNHTPLICSTPAAAWDAVCDWAADDDLVVVAGSFFIAADMRRQFDRRPLRPVTARPARESA